MVVTQQAATPLRIGTRGSKLALAQAYETRDRLLKSSDEIAARGVTIEAITTTGDAVQDRNLSEIGGKGLFTKEIEEALLAGSIDLAVHSMKDMPTILPDGLVLAAVLPREDPRDVFLANGDMGIDELPAGSVVGTSSLRRRAQVLHRRSDLRVADFRGNVDTRLGKLADGVVDATLLARAGLNRLKRHDVGGVSLPVEDFLPAVAQGIVTIECRAEDFETLDVLAALDHPETDVCATAERAFLTVLDGSCRTPIAGHAQLDGETVWLRGAVIAPDGSAGHDGERRGPANDAQSLGEDLGRELLTSAGDILAALS